MHNKAIIGLLFFALLSSISCAPVYAPTKNNVPLLSGKGELQLYAGAGVGVNFQTAYALTDHIGLAGNYLYLKNGDRSENIKHQAGEIAIGYYTKIRPDLLFEIYGGYGLGEGSAKQIGDLFSSSISGTSTYQKFYIQPAIGSTDRWFRWNFSLKGSLVDFTSLKITESGEDDITSVSPKFFLTPAVTTAYDFWNGKLSASLQLGVNTHVGNKAGLHYFFLVGSVGLTYKIKPTISGQ